MDTQVGLANSNRLGEIVRVLKRVAVLTGAILIAALLIWRGNDYITSETGRVDLTAPVMCLASAVMVGLTGVAFCMKGDE